MTGSRASRADAIGQFRLTAMTMVWNIADVRIFLGQLRVRARTTTQYRHGRRFVVDRQPLRLVAATEAAKAADAVVAGHVELEHDLAGIHRSTLVLSIGIIFRTFVDGGWRTACFRYRQVTEKESIDSIGSFRKETKLAYAIVSQQNAWSSKLRLWRLHCNPRMSKDLIS